MYQTESLIDRCLSDGTACLQAFEALLNQLPRAEIDREAGACILRLMDCAQICETGLGLIGRGSPLTEELCVLWRTACEECAGRLELAGIGGACAAKCRRCAARCRQLGGALRGVDASSCRLGVGRPRPMDGCLE
ncbi:MAG TPA: hypothetical protein VM029_21100 [Opitutaceae bacterium]|nr:hypothetical protein [Opitutaceae bacterium]